MSGKRQTPMVKQLHKTLEEMVRVRSVLTGMQTGNAGNKVTDTIEECHPGLANGGQTPSLEVHRRA